jgi:hypothetical protein
MADQLARFQIIIKSFDEQLQLRSLKTEFSELVIRLREYTKKTTHERLATQVKDNHNSTKQQFARVDEKFAEQA